MFIYKYRKVFIQLIFASQEALCTENNLFRDTYLFLYPVGWLASRYIQDTDIYFATPLYLSREKFLKI